MRPSAQSGRIGRARRIFAVWRCLLHGSTCGDAPAGLLSTSQAERCSRHQTIGQDGEGLAARMTDSASHPNAFVPVIVALTQPSSMANNRVVPTERTSPRQEAQWDHPGSTLSFVSGSAINRITAGVKARRDRSLLKFRSAGWAFTLQQSQFQTKKEYCFPPGDASLHPGHWPV